MVVVRGGGGGGGAVNSHTQKQKSVESAICAK